MATGRPVRLPIHVLKDRLSGVVAEIERTGEEVVITRHGRVVARLLPAPSSGVVLGAGVDPGGRPAAAVPEVDDLAWVDDELDEMLGAPVEPL